jgi:hypothetical protein
VARHSRGEIGNIRWGGGWWDRLHFLTGRSKSNDLPSHNRGKHDNKRRTTGFGLKRPGDGVAPSFFEGDFGIIFLRGGGGSNTQFSQRHTLRLHTL